MGTYGYMAPEQFRGQAFLSTDLYGLGTTLLFLLTQKSPSELPQRKLKINFRPHISLSKEFADWLEKMLSPVVEDRFPSALAALAVLRGEQPLSNYSVAKLSLPEGSPIMLNPTEEQLVIKIPSVWFRTSGSILFGLIVLAWNHLCLLLLSKGTIFTFVYFPFDLFILSLGIFGLVILLYYLFNAAYSIRLTMDSEKLLLKRWFLGWCFQEVQASKSEISEVKVARSYVLTACLLRIRWRKYEFGLFLTEAEKKWLVEEISRWTEE